MTLRMIKSDLLFPHESLRRCEHGTDHFDKSQLIWQNVIINLQNQNISLERLSNRKWMV